MARRKGTEGFHTRVVKMNKRKKIEDLDELEEVEETYESCVDDLPADIRRAVINGLRGLD